MKPYLLRQAIKTSCKIITSLPCSNHISHSFNLSQREAWYLCLSIKCSVIKDKSSQPKEYVRATIYTSGLPKGSNSHGNRVTIVGRTINVQRVTVSTVSTRHDYCTLGTSEVITRIKKLKLRSETRPNLSINKNLHSLLYSSSLLNMAYNNIKSRPGIMRTGIIPETLDGISQEVLESISKSLKDESFQFKPGRRILIPKSNGGLRPLTLATPTFVH